MTSLKWLRLLLGAQAVICAVTLGWARECASCDTVAADYAIPIAGLTYYALLFVVSLRKGSGAAVAWMGLLAFAVHVGLVLSQGWTARWCVLCAVAAVGACAIAWVAIRAHGRPLPTTGKVIAVVLALAVAVGATIQSEARQRFTFLARIDRSKLEVPEDHTRLLVLTSANCRECDWFRSTVEPQLRREFAKCEIEYLDNASIGAPGVPVYILVMPGFNVRVCKSRGEYSRLRAWLLRAEGAAGSSRTADRESG